MWWRYTMPAAQNDQIKRAQGVWHTTRLVDLARAGLRAQAAGPGDASLLNR